MLKPIFVVLRGLREMKLHIVILIMLLLIFFSLDSFLYT